MGDAALSQEMRVEIDCDACTGHGRCYDLAPNVFAEDERGYGQVRDSVLRPKLMQEVRSAILNCPERAIRLHKVVPEHK